MGGNQSMPKITKQDRAILESIQAVLGREHQIAKAQLAAGNKDRALIALRKRKYQEGLLAKTDTQLENLEKLVSTIEFSLVEVSVLHGLQQGNEVLKEIHKELNVENVERIMEETAEAREYQREIDEMLGNSLSAEDEEEVQAELLALQREELGVVELPSVPIHPVEDLEEGKNLPTLLPHMADLDTEREPQSQTERVPVAA
ncbi:Snf7-domain-containing protein [Epithele typhae]|uniref:Snf7-domain-containing protein n=1 Tax=Epithele typhae TaxID=378194 RepID=UPI0020087786|nr:Snf7-domain-containing protein [Epithele typhae]KAH9944127.1 Snf7-domain-containing protein [Epithele typhae]